LLLPIAGAQLFTNLLLQVDLAFLGRFLGEGAMAQGLIGDMARDAAKEWAGVYKACQTFAFLPYQLLFSITQVLFPMLARAKAEGDEEAVRRYVMRGARLAAIACGLLVGVVVALPGSLLSFAYGPEVAARGASALRILALGQGAFAMLGIATTILTSIGRERVAAGMTLGAVIAVAVACTVAVPGAAFGATQIERTAMATTGSLVVTLLVAGFVVRSCTGGFVPAATILRTGTALVLCIVAGFYLPMFGKLVTPLVSAGIAVVYLGMLVGLREIGGEDLQLLKAVAGKRKAA
jgi:stage V sporulation protein B